MEALKELLINTSKVKIIADEIGKVYPQFAHKEFINEVATNLGKLELKARINWIAVCLQKYLPSQYQKAIVIIIKSLPPPCNPNLQDNDFGDFIYAVYGDFIVAQGLEKKDLPTTLLAIKEITTRFSMEYTIRHIINKYPKETMAQLYKWVNDKHYHVRRLCSEGSRPRLPWGININIDYQQSLPILEKLYNDKSRFVTRSVANHLNDISKINPDLLINLLAKWQAKQKAKSAEFDFLVAHSLRTLIKQGNRPALEFIGYKQNQNFKVDDFKCSKQITINSALEFSFLIKNPTNQALQLLIDYQIHFANAKGEMKNHKTFKLKKINLPAQSQQLITKSHPFKTMTTRKLYCGKHKIALQINGEIPAEKIFNLNF